MTVHILPLPDMPTPVPDAGLGALSTGQGNLPLEFVEAPESEAEIARQTAEALWQGLLGDPRA